MWDEEEGRNKGGGVRVVVVDVRVVTVDVRGGGRSAGCRWEGEGRREKRRRSG